MAEQKMTLDGVNYTDYLSDQPESMKNEKRALLAAFAESGTEGQAEYERNRRLAKDTRASSIEQASARGGAVHAPAALNAELTQDTDKIINGILSTTDDGMLGHGREMDRIAAANAAYLDAVSGAAQIEAGQFGASGGGGGGGRGGGGGGGGGRGGGGGGSYQDFASLMPNGMTLNEAGMAAGGADGTGETSQVGIGQILGQADLEVYDPERGIYVASDGTPAVGGNKSAKDAFHWVREQLAAGAVNPDDPAAVVELLSAAGAMMDEGGTYTGDQALALAGIANYFGLVGEDNATADDIAEMGLINVSTDEDGNTIFGPVGKSIYGYTTEEGLQYNIDQEAGRFQNRSDVQQGEQNPENLRDSMLRRAANGDAYAVRWLSQQQGEGADVTLDHAGRLVQTQRESQYQLPDIRQGLRDSKRDNIVDYRQSLADRRTAMEEAKERANLELLARQARELAAQKAEEESTANRLKAAVSGEKAASGAGSSIAAAIQAAIAKKQGRTKTTGGMLKK